VFRQTDKGVEPPAAGEQPPRKEKEEQGKEPKPQSDLVSQQAVGDEETE
jgi:hypothetical protein